MNFASHLVRQEKGLTASSRDSHEASAGAHESAAGRVAADASAERDARERRNGSNNGGSCNGRDGLAVNGGDGRVRARARNVAKLLAVVALGAGGIEGAVRVQKREQIKSQLARSRLGRKAEETKGKLTRPESRGTRRRGDPCRRTSSTACCPPPWGSGTRSTRVRARSS
jgi:hypothetical protein